MWRHLLLRLATIVLGLFIFIAPVTAQNRPADRMQYQNPGEEPIERGPPVLPYTLALLATILVMFILCMPSRKRVTE